MENVLAEVYDIIMHSEQAIVEKIPTKFLKFIKDNKNDNYKVNINYNENINNQKLLKDTRIMLSLIYRDYLISKEQRKSLIEQEEKYIREKYKVTFNKKNAIANKKENENNLIKEENHQMIEYKESIIKRILIRILKIFKKS